MTVLFILVQILRIVHYVILLTEDKSLVKLLTPILYIITAITIVWLMNYNRLKRIFSSGLLFVFWLLVSLASIPDIIDYSITFHQQVNYLDEYLNVNIHYLSRSNQYHCG